MLPYKSKDQEVAGMMMATPGTMATVSHAIALHFFGADIYEWEPETLAMELQDELGVNVDEDNMDRLHAIIAAVTSDSFNNDWAAFTAICSALNGETDPEDIAEMTVAEFAWGVIEVGLNDEDESGIYSPDICALVGVVLDQEGFTSAPEWLKFAKMPEKYLGYESRGQLESQSGYHHDLVREYLRDQALLLYKQIQMIPWLDGADVEQMVGELSKEIGSSQESGDPIYAPVA